MDVKSKSPMRDRAGGSMEPPLSRERIRTKGATPMTSRSAKKKKRKKKRRDSERIVVMDEDLKLGDGGDSDGVEESKVSVETDTVHGDALESQLKGLDAAAVEDIMHKANNAGEMNETKLNLEEESTDMIVPSDSLEDVKDGADDKELEIEVPTTPVASANSSGMGFAPSASPTSLSAKMQSVSPIVDDDEAMHLAATKLQSRIRMHNSKRTFMKEKHVREEKERKQQESQQRSCIAIQSLFRGKRARELKQTLMLKQAAAAFNKEYRASSIISRAILQWIISVRERKQNAALVLQRSYQSKRQKVLARQARQEVMEREHQSATMIQSTYRGKITRNKHLQQTEERQTEEKVHQNTVPIRVVERSSTDRGETLLGREQQAEKRHDEGIKRSAPSPVASHSKGHTTHGVHHHRPHSSHDHEQEARERHNMSVMEIESIAIDRASCRHYIYHLESTLNTVDTRNQQAAVTLSYQQQQQHKEQVLKSLQWEEEAQRRMAEQKQKYENSLHEVDLILRNKVQSFAKVKEANETLIQYLQSVVSQMQEEKCALQHQLAQEKEGRRQDSDTITQLERELDRMQRDHDATVLRQQEKHETIIVDLSSTHSQTVSDLKEKQQKHLEHLSAIHRRDILDNSDIRDSLHDETVRDKDALIEELQSQLKALEDTLEKDKKSHDEAYDLLMTKYNEESTNWVEVYGEKQSELDKLEAELLEAYESLESAQASARVATYKQQKLAAELNVEGKVSTNNDGDDDEKWKKNKFHKRLIEDGDNDDDDNNDDDDDDDGADSTELQNHHKQILKAIEYKVSKSGGESSPEVWRNEHILSFFKLFKVNRSILSRISEYSVTGEYMDMVGAPTLALYGMSHPHEIQTLLKAWRRIRMNKLTPSDLFANDNIDEHRHRIAELEKELLESLTEKERVQAMYVELAERMDGIDLAYKHKMNMQALNFTTQQTALELQIKKMVSPTQEEQLVQQKAQIYRDVHASHTKDVFAHVLSTGFARAHSKHLRERHEKVVSEVHHTYQKQIESRQLRHQQDISTHRAIIEGHKDQLKKHKNTFEQQKAAIEEKNALIAEQKEHFKTLIEQLEAHKKEREDELTAHIASVTAAKQAVHENHDQLAKDLDKYKDIHENHKISKDAEIALAHKVIEECRAQVSRLQNEIKRLVVVEQDLQDIQKTLEKEVVALKEEHGNLQEINNAYREKVDMYITAVKKTVRDMELWGNQLQAQQAKSADDHSSSGKEGGRDVIFYPTMSTATNTAYKQFRESVNQLASQEEALLGILGALGLDGNSTELAMMRGHQSALKAHRDGKEVQTQKELESDKFEFLAHEEIPLELEARLKKSKVHEAYFKKLREENSSLRMKVARLEREKRDIVTEGVYHRKPYPHSHTSNDDKQYRSPQRQAKGDNKDKDTEGDISLSDANHIASVNTQRPVSMQAPRATDTKDGNGEREDNVESPRRRNSWHSLNANSLMSNSDIGPGVQLGAGNNQEEDDGYYYPSNNDANDNNMDAEDEREGIQVGFQESKLDYSEVYAGGGNNSSNYDSYQPNPYQDLDELVRYDTEAFGAVVGMPDQSLDTIYSNSPGTIVYSNAGNGNTPLIYPPTTGSEGGEIHNSTNIIDTNMEGSGVTTDDVLLSYRIKLANAAKRIATLESERSILIARLSDAQEVIQELTDTQMKMLKKIASGDADLVGNDVDLSPRWNDGDGSKQKRRSRSPASRGSSEYSRGQKSGYGNAKPQAPTTAPPRGVSRAGERSVGRSKGDRVARFNEVKWDDSTTISSHGRMDRAWMPTSKPGRHMRVYETPSVQESGVYQQTYEGVNANYDPTRANGNGHESNNNGDDDNDTHGVYFPEHSVNDQGVPSILVSPRYDPSKAGGGRGTPSSTSSRTSKPKIKPFRGFAAPQMHHIPRMNNLKKSSMFPTDQPPALGFDKFHNVPRSANSKSQ